MMTHHSNQTVPIKGLFEAHLTVSNLRRSINFYRDKLGLQLALKVTDRNAAFFWIGDSRRSMLGLWSIGSAPLGLTLHIAFDVNLSDLLSAPKRLRAQGISPLTFFGKETDEPSVIGWMPAAAIYFRDPDGHLIEFLTMLDMEPDANIGIVTWSNWFGSRNFQAR
jgi:lactoylglutathione lyase